MFCMSSHETPHCFHFLDVWNWFTHLDHTLRLVQYHVYTLPKVCSEEALLHFRVRNLISLFLFYFSSMHCKTTQILHTCTVESVETALIIPNLCMHCKILSAEISFISTYFTFMIFFLLIVWMYNVLVYDIYHSNLLSPYISPVPTSLYESTTYEVHKIIVRISQVPYFITFS